MSLASLSIIRIKLIIKPTNSYLHFFIGDSKSKIKPIYILLKRKKINANINVEEIAPDESNGRYS